MGETGQHGQLTRRAFLFLHSAMEVNFECFASPLNWQIGSYCSAFNDCDHWFGSQGSFFDFMPTQDGSFEVNPPFMIHGAAVEDHLATIFRKCGEMYALSFTLVYPSSHYLDCSVKNHWVLSRVAQKVKKKIVLGKSMHQYFRGNQHELNEAEAVAMDASHATTIYILQNERGWARYGGHQHPDFEVGIKEAFKI